MTATAIWTDSTGSSASSGSPSTTSSSASDMAPGWVTSWKKMYAQYAMMMMTEQIRDTGSKTSSIVASPSTKVSEWKTVTRLKERQESSNIDVLTSADIEEKVCTFSLTKAEVSSMASTPLPMTLVRIFFVLLPTIPPKKKDMPSTSKRFDNTEPRSVALTTSMRPARRVCTIMTISTALPKEAFNKPASMSFFRPAASSSVASPRSFARGTSAKKFKKNTHIGPHFWKCATMPSGQQMTNTLRGCLKRAMSPTPSMFGGFGTLVPEMKREARLTLS
mmetsp:Transcript_98166/g.249076  ORF Transcript_98166/g.249076 Transcript_98166/m.249076 type:complete len:277 (+) Transcript_98166:593-1423(+)